MNNFYDISGNEKGVQKPLQLLNLGNRRPSITIGKPTRDSYGGRSFQSHTYYTATTAADYDRQFVERIKKFNPPYDVEQLLNHHFEYYTQKEANLPETFIKHIKYVIIPLIEKTGKHKVFADLLNEWLDGIKNRTKTSPNQLTDNITTTPINNSINYGETIKNISMSEVFISYSWDSLQHEQKVLEFTEHLRKKGFDASLDKMLSQQETATNFIKMMHKAMLEHRKVIVVLSPGYKTKAETFTGGVGEEYQLLLNDINNHPKKYILVSFEGRSPDIIPFGLQGREITDLSLPDGEEKLFRKLMDKDNYVFSPVASEKPLLDPVKIGEFQATLPQAISIENPEIFKGDTSSVGGLYKFLEFELFLKFKNNSNKSVDGFAYTLKLKQQLAPEYYGEPATDGYFIFNESISQKIFPGQLIKTKGYKIKIAYHSLQHILGTSITIEAFTDYGNETKEYAIEEIFKVSPANEQYKEPVPLSKDFFC